MSYDEGGEIVFSCGMMLLLLWRSTIDVTTITPQQQQQDLVTSQICEHFLEHFCVNKGFYNGFLCSANHKRWWRIGPLLKSANIDLDKFPSRHELMYFIYLRESRLWGAFNPRLPSPFVILFALVFFKEFEKLPLWLRLYYNVYFFLLCFALTIYSGT